MTKLQDNPLMMWLIGALFMISMALSGVVYAAVNARVTTLETDNKLDVLLLSEVKGKLAVLENNAIWLQKSVSDVKELQSLSSKKLDMLLISSQRASQWRDVVDERNKADSTRWNRAMDAQPSAVKK